ncbi:MAG: hypothetical protein Kow00129_14540 [Thermoleophilia bacterium]
MPKFIVNKGYEDVHEVEADSFQVRENGAVIFLEGNPVHGKSKTVAAFAEGAWRTVEQIEEPQKTS